MNDAPTGTLLIGVPSQRTALGLVRRQAIRSLAGANTSHAALRFLIATDLAQGIEEPDLWKLDLPKSRRFTRSSRPGKSNYGLEKWCARSHHPLGA